MSASGRDTDRRATYEAEAVAFDGTDLEAPLPFHQLAATASVIVDGSWWNGPRVVVQRARRDAETSTARSDGGGGSVDVRLSQPGCTPATLAHELAHALVGVERGHDALFRRAELDLVAVITNLDSTDRRGSVHRDALGEAFDRFGLDVADRRWADPASEDGPAGSAGRAIAL